MSEHKSPIEPPKDDYTLDELIEVLTSIRNTEPAVYGKKKVVFKTAGRLLPNATYKIVIHPSYAHEHDRRIQIFPGGYTQ